MGGGSVLAVLIAAAASAPPRPSDHVRWDAPSGCPGEPEVRARVDAMLATGGSGRREPIRLHMTVAATAEGFRLTAALVGEDGDTGERVVRGSSCEDLADAAVLIAAIAIDPDLVPPELPPAVPEAPVVPEPDPDPDPVPVPVPVPVPEPVSRVRDTTAPEPPPPRAPARDVAGVVQLGLGLGLGRLAAPVPMALARISGGVEVGAFRGLVRASGFGPSFGDVPGFDTGGVFGAVTGGIAGCGRTLGAPWSFVGCLGTDVGVAVGRGRRTDNTLTARSPWWGIEAEAAVEYAFSPRWSLTFALEGAVMPVRTRFVVDGEGHACCVRWGAGARVGVLARFGPAAR